MEFTKELLRYILSMLLLVTVMFFEWPLLLGNFVLSGKDLSEEGHYVITVGAWTWVGIWNLFLFCSFVIPHIRIVG
jgi:hypothetical protein